MTRLSLLDKLMILFNVIKSSNIYLVLLGIFIVIFTIVSIITIKNKKLGRTIYGMGMISIIIYLVISYHPYLLKMFQYMMDNFFIALYFPTLAIYLAAIIIMNIIIWKTVFSNKSSKFIKILNTIIYFIMNYLLILNCSVITKEKLDVFDQSSIYQNDQARALIELSSVIFILWIVFLILYKCIYEYLIKDLPKRNKSYKIVESPKVAYSEQELKEYVFQKDKNYQVIDSPSTIKGKKQSNKEKDYVFITSPETIQGKKKSEKNYIFISAPEMVQRQKTTLTLEREYTPKRRKSTWNKFVDFMLMREEKPVAMKIVSPKESIQRDYQITSTPSMIIGQKKKEKNYQNIDLPSIIRGKKVEKKEKYYDQSFTLEDYKLFSQILKNHKNNKAQEIVEKPKTKVVEVKEEVKPKVEEQLVLENIPIDNNRYRAMDNERSEKIFGSMNDIDKYREEQKKEIIEMENERRKLLNKQINKQRKIDLKEEQEILERKRQNEEQREQNKMTELERLYQGINF